MRYAHLLGLVITILICFKDLEALSLKRREHFGLSYLNGTKKQQENIILQKDSYAKLGPLFKTKINSVNFSYFYRVPETIFLGGEITLLQGKIPRFILINKEDAPQNKTDSIPGERLGVEGKLRLGYSFRGNDRFLVSFFGLYGQSKYRDNFKETLENGTMISQVLKRANTTSYGGGSYLSYSLNDFFDLSFEAEGAFVQKKITQEELSECLQEGVSYSFSPALAYYIPKTSLMLKSGASYAAIDYKANDSLSKEKSVSVHFFFSGYLFF